MFMKSRIKLAFCLFCVFNIEESTAVSLQARVQELEGKQNELLSTIEVRENEFGKKRAQFKEIFLQKESKLFKPTFLFLCL